MSSRSRSSVSPSKTPSWRKDLKQRQKRQWKALLRVGIWLAVLLIMGSLVLEVWRGWRRSQWDGKSTFYLGVQTGETAWLVKVDPEQEDLYIGKIPGNLMVQAARGFGEYQAKNLYQLGDQEEIGGIRLVRESLVWTFGLPVKGIVRVPQEQQELRLSAALFKSVVGLGETNLTRWDSLRLWLFVSALRPDQEEQFSFSQVPGVSSKERPDGVSVLVIDQDRLDRWLAQRFTSTELVNEPFTWEVVNASGHPGLAAQVGRLLRNTGIQVVQVMDGEAPQEGIFTDKKIDSSAVQFFSAFLQVPVSQEKLGAHSADVVVGIGEEFALSCCSHQAD